MVIFSSFPIQAIKSGKYEIIEYLASIYDISWLDANIDCGNSGILYHSCAKGNLEMVKYKKDEQLW